jgi:hypothetical protein
MDFYSLAMSKLQLMLIELLWIHFLDMSTGHLFVPPK